MVDADGDPDIEFETGPAAGKIVRKYAKDYEKLQTGGWCLVA